jgi:hypothetical protein
MTAPSASCSARRVPRQRRFRPLPAAAGPHGLAPFVAWRRLRRCSSWRGLVRIGPWLRRPKDGMANHSGMQGSRLGRRGEPPRVPPPSHCLPPRKRGGQLADSCLHGGQAQGSIPAAAIGHNFLDQRDEIAEKESCGEQRDWGLERRPFGGRSIAPL